MLARKSLLAFGTDILKAAFGFAATYFVAHYLGASALGTVGHLLSLVGTLALVSDLGLHQAFRKCASERPEDNAGYVTALIGAKALLGLLLFGACVMAPVVDPRLGEQLRQADVRGAYWAIAAYYLLNSLSSIPALTFQARRETAKYTLPGTMGALVSSGAKIAMALMHASLTGLAIAYTLETTVGLVISLWMFRRYPLRRPNRDEVGHLIRYSRPMVVVTALAYILPNVDRILLERSWDAREVGYYTAVLGLVALVQRIPLAAMNIFLPQAAEDVARGELREVERRLFVLERYLLMITVPVCAAVALASQAIARAYLGPEFARSGPILAVLAINPIMVALFEPYNSVVYAVEKHQYLVPSGLLSLGILLLADGLLVPRALGRTALLGLGGLGAAIGGLISQAVNGAFQVGIARRYAKVGLYWRAARFAAAGAAMVASGLAVQRIAGSTSAWAMAAALIVGGAFYLSTLALLREFTLGDARLFLQLLHPRRMLDYVTAELLGTKRNQDARAED